MIILGIGGLLGDAAAAILKDGELAAAVEESKLVRRRTHWGGLDEMPEHAIATCLELAGAKPEQVDAVAVVRPIPESRFPPEAARAISQQPHRRGGASPGACRVGLLSLAVRRGHRAHARSRRRFPLRLPLAARAARSSSLEQEQYSPDSLGDLYGRVTELLGFEANVDEHKVQWLSVAGDDRYRGLFLEISARLRCRPAHRPRVSSAPSASATAASARASSSGSAWPTGSRSPRNCAPHLAAGVQHAVEDAVIRMAGKGDNLCLAGGLGLNALLVSALEKRSGLRQRLRAAGRRQRRNRHRRGARSLARRLSPDRARRHEHAEPRPRLHRRRDQAGAGELQAALPLHGHHRRGDRYRRGAVERPQDRRLDARPHGVRRARAGQSQHSGIARSIPIPRRT